MASLRQLTALLAPLIIFLVVPMTLALRDLALRRSDEVTGGNRLVWRIIILAIGVFGPLAYFAFGRRRQ